MRGSVPRADGHSDKMGPRAFLSLCLQILLPGSRRRGPPPQQRLLPSSPVGPLEGSSHHSALTRPLQGTERPAGGTAPSLQDQTRREAPWAEPDPHPEPDCRRLWETPFPRPASTQEGTGRTAGPGSVLGASLGCHPQACPVPTLNSAARSLPPVPATPLGACAKARTPPSWEARVHCPSAPGAAGEQARAHEEPAPSPREAMSAAAGEGPGLGDPHVPVPPTPREMPRTRAQPLGPVPVCTCRSLEGRDRVGVEPGVTEGGWRPGRADPREQFAYGHFRARCREQEIPLEVTPREHSPRTLPRMWPARPEP